LGVAGFTLVTDHAEHMGLVPLIIDGVAHGLAVDGKTFVFLSVGFVPMLQGSVQMHGINTDQDIADDGLTWDILYSPCQEKN
jgi:Na+-transporting NADH:ubiquinone oxidoreductase subunit NqrD